MQLGHCRRRALCEAGMRKRGALCCIDPRVHKNRCAAMGPQMWGALLRRKLEVGGRGAKGTLVLSGRGLRTLTLHNPHAQDGAQTM
ncbi:unnamed protein product [Leptosia nina]|uniref:Uncharacterized protein n=1 Tax=Leptosia nina TaxID=320188 RepID=A0AAV1JSG2_9NEOP